MARVCAPCCLVPSRRRSMTRYKKVADWTTGGSYFELDESSLDEILEQVKVLKEKYPYTHTPRSGEPYVISHCTIDLREVDYVEYLGIIVDEWTEVTPEDIRLEEEATRKRDANTLVCKRNRFERLKKELGE
jgi:hypothetical protein